MKNLFYELCALLVKIMVIVALLGTLAILFFSCSKEVCKPQRLLKDSIGITDPIKPLQTAKIVNP